MKIGFDFKYLCAFIVILLVETAIAVFVQDGYIRGSVGDILVVVLIYCLVKAFVRTETKLLPLFILIFAILVEVLQGFNIIELVGLGDVAVARVLIGSTFDIVDIGCYVVGCAALALFEMVVRRRTRTHLTQARP
jgi:hypothetical protein